MSLFDYTKKISEKIKFYDNISRKKYFGYKNPFSQPVSYTIVWVEKDYLP